MGFLKGGHTPVRHPVPQLDAAVFATGDVAVSAGIVTDSADGVCVLVQRVAGHKTLESVNVIKTQGWVLCAD